MYETDLAHIHHEGFTEFAETASEGILALLPKSGAVVDVGCGSGVLSRALTRAGLAVFDFDASPAMIELARRTSPQATFAVARFGEAELPPCDAIVSIGEVLNYGTFDEVRAFIDHAASALRAGGILLFDIAERGGYPPHDEVRVSGDDWHVIAIKDSDGAHLTRRVLTFRRIGGEVRRSEEMHQLELYERGAMLELLRPHFKVTVRRSYGSYRLPKGHAVYHAVKRERRSGGSIGQASFARPKIR